MNLAGVKGKKFLGFFCRVRHVGVDLRLVFTEIIDDVPVVRERVEGQGKRAVSRDPEAFFFKAEVSFKEQRPDGVIFNMKHSISPKF